MTPSPDTGAGTPLTALADKWEAAADRTMERAMQGDPAAAMAAARALRGCAADLRSRPATDPAGLDWTAAQHREDAKLVQAAMQRLAERRRLVDRRYGSIHVPIEDASDLLMALHRDGIYRAARLSVADGPGPEERPSVDALSAALHATAGRHHNLGEGLARAICDNIESHRGRAEASLWSLYAALPVHREETGR